MIEQTVIDTVGLPPGMQRSHLSSWNRAFRAIIIIVPLVGAAGMLVLGHPDDPALWAVAAIIALTAIVGGLAAWRKRSQILPAYDVYVIPASEKKQRLYESLIYTCWVLAGVGVLVYFESSNKFNDGVIFGGLVLFFEACFATSVILHRYRHVLPGKLETLGPWKSSMPKLPSAKGFPWFYRYPSAVILIYLAYQVSLLPDKGGSALVLFGIGVCMMYEILAGVVICALVYWFFGALAAVPTSVAVLIGAYWIAESNKNNK